MFDSSGLRAVPDRQRIEGNTYTVVRYYDGYTMEGRTCAVCAEDFPRAEFPVHNSTPDGVGARCSTCEDRAKLVKKALDYVSGIYPSRPTIGLVQTPGFFGLGAKPTTSGDTMSVSFNGMTETGLRDLGRLTLLRTQHRLILTAYGSNGSLTARASQKLPNNKIDKILEAYSSFPLDVGLVLWKSVSTTVNDN